MLLGLYGSCSWVSMAPALGSLWLLLLLIGQIVRVTKQVTFQEVKVTSDCTRSRSHQVTSSRNRSHQVARQQVMGLHIRSRPIGSDASTRRPPHGQPTNNKQTPDIIETIRFSLLFRCLGDNELQICAQQVTSGRPTTGHGFTI